MQKVHNTLIGGYWVEETLEATLSTEMLKMTEI